MATSCSEQTQAAARDLLEQLAEGNPRFRDHVYKALVAVLLCDSPKAQQFALQSIRILQTGNPVANRALIDLICRILESLYFPVQAAALELLRTLMSCDIADDILKALVELLHPQREIELSKLFKQSANVLLEGSSSIISSDEEREDELFSIAGGHRHEISIRDDEIKGTEQDREDTMTANTAFTENSQLMVAQPTQSIHSSVTYQPGNVGAKTVTSHQRPRRKGKYGSSSGQRASEKEQEASDPDDQVMVPPIPVFVQQASAARCIAVLIEDSVDVTKRLLKFGALSGLLYAMGNLEYSDSQRQASRAVKILSMKYPQISSIVEEVMGRVLFDEFYNKTDQFYLYMTPLQADLLVSSKTKFAGIDEINLEG
ncbi:unnamed protein product [Hymenolepis diminuta]|uniref:Uncharacterized protein n=2 Tax=Hymenolepis diminuta TaxID=6216 RepID=A0A564YPY9_HYMDI|nr:unnamed protein product [Hymenolepis diminuta]